MRHLKPTVPRVGMGLLILTISAATLDNVRIEAQTAGLIDASLYSAMRWRSVGPARGGRSIAVAGSAARTNEYYFGAVGGGVWKSTDFGHDGRGVFPRQHHPG
ncbi:MAG: hypothetical protein LC791_17765 [Acidobacteria bacterium]|nr:hypothetical protein [Acidobacteriota bacterium]